jgi:hypothetical protein
MGTDVEEGRLGEIDRHGAHAPTTCVRQQAGRPPIELPRNVEHTLPPFDAHRRRRREAGRARRHRERVSALGAFQRLGRETILTELAHQDRVPSPQHTELVRHVLELHQNWTSRMAARLHPPSTSR